MELYNVKFELNRSLSNAYLWIQMEYSIRVEEGRDIRDLMTQPNI